MLAEWLKKAGADGQAVDRRLPQVTHAERCRCAVLRRARRALRRRRRIWRRCSWSGTLAMVLPASPAACSSFNLRGTDAYAGYCMAAAGFLALAHTLKRGEHIRVTLVLEHVGARGAARARALVRSPPATLLCGAVRVLQRAPRVAVVRTSTTSRPATTPRRCGSRSSRWPLGTSCCAIAFVDDFVLRAARAARSCRQRRRSAAQSSSAMDLADHRRC